MDVSLPDDDSEGRGGAFGSEQQSNHMPHQMSRHSSQLGIDRTQTMLNKAVDNNSLRNHKVSSHSAKMAKSTNKLKQSTV